MDFTGRFETWRRRGCLPKSNRLACRGGMAFGFALLLIVGFGGLASAFGGETAGAGRSSESTEATCPEPAAAVQRVGPPVFYMPEVDRVAEAISRSPKRHPRIPDEPVTRQTYFDWLKRSGHFRYAENPGGHGKYGPRHFGPVLAKYVKSGEAKYGRACLEMLKHYKRWMEQEIAEKGWHSHYMHEPYYLGLYRRYLSEGGLLDLEQDTWFKELVLLASRNVHVWGTEPDFWRGPMHRAQGEGAMKHLAALWYPEAPEAPAWRDYAARVYQDWWPFRDVPTNDTGYMFGILFPLFLRAELTGDEAFFNDPEARKTWERLMWELSPDGSVIPYGAHGGWNSTAGNRILMLELLAKHTGDGRYRYAAAKLMNYLLYQESRYRRHHMLDGPFTTEPLALAYLLADDRIQPVEPSPASRVVRRKETLRLFDHRDKRIAARFLGDDIDPDPNKAHICCGLVVTEKEMPSKLILRSGWKRGDFFVLVDLFARHDPLNVPGILGITRWGAATTATISAKGESDENRVIIRDLKGDAPRVTNDDPDLRDPYYQEVEVPQMTDLGRATFATVVVHDYQGFPVRHTREFVFVKNRFLVTREILEFREGFEAEIGPVFNTQNVGPQIGRHWANTFMSEPIASTRSLRNPPVDLLVYFLPQPDCRMQVVDRTAADPRTLNVPAQLRYVRSGKVAPGEKLHFAEVYYPHVPSMKLVRSNAAGDRRNRNLLGTAGADAIEVLRDDPQATVLRMQFEPGRTEWVVCNPGGTPLDLKQGLATDAQAAYVAVVDGEIAGVAADQATYVRGAGMEALAAGQLTRKERGAIEH